MQQGRERISMLNTNKIKARIVELGMTNKDVASALHIALPTVSQKINNVRPMSLDEAEKLGKLLRIRDAEFTLYFFVDYVA
jgi:plasmid maintenance system antidote protein VapI